MPERSIKVDVTIKTPRHPSVEDISRVAAQGALVKFNDVAGCRFEAEVFNDAQRGIRVNGLGDEFFFIRDTEDGWMGLAYDAERSAWYVHTDPELVRMAQEFLEIGLIRIGKVKKPKKHRDCGLLKPGE